MRLTRALFITLTIASAFTGCDRTKMQTPGKNTMPSSEASVLDSMIRRFAPTDITADTARLVAGDRLALARIIEAAAFLDPLFRRQVWRGNDSLLARLETDTSTVGRARLHYFRINAGPWSRLDKNRSFVPGVPDKPLGAGFYPDDLTKPEFEAWTKALPAAERQRAEGFFWLIQRKTDRTLTTVPYSQAYRDVLEPMAQRLRDAAALTPNASLRKFLTTRADAFLSDDYYASDVAWMDLDAPIDVTFGPYETYEDELYSYKASFEAYVTLRDDAETAKLQKFSGYLQELEDHLPIDPKYRRPKLGAASPIRVVDEVFASGDGNRGVQTSAFNLPNDERVVREKGSKRVMLKNVQEAKFNQALVPIARMVLDSADRANVSFDAFFTHTLAHELMHGLGPQTITVAGRATSVRKELKELHSAIEEAKADVTGLWALQYLIDKGVVDKALERTLYKTFLASMFRSVRFGITEAHGKGQAMQFNYLAERGAFVTSADSMTFRVDPAKFKDGIRHITHDLLTIEATGDYGGAKAILDRYAVIKPELQRVLDRLAGVPVDIEPSYPLAKGVTRR
jgi:peptidase M49-like protein